MNSDWKAKMFVAFPRTVTVMRALETAQFDRPSKIKQAAEALALVGTEYITKAQAWEIVFQGAQKCGYAVSVELDAATALLFKKGWDAGVKQRPKTPGRSRTHECTNRCVPANCFQKRRESVSK